MFFLNLQTSGTIAHGFFFLTAWKVGIELWNRSIFLASLLAFLFSLSSKGTRISKESQNKSFLSTVASAVAF